MYCLEELSEKLGCVVLVLGGDLDGSNVRAKHYVVSLVQEINKKGAGQILILDVSCAVHVMHRIIETAFETQFLIPKLHATAYVCFHTDVVERMLKVTKDIVLEDLMSGGSLGNVPIRS